MKLTIIFVVFLYGFPNVVKFLFCLNIPFFVVLLIQLISTTLGILNCLLSLLSPPLFNSFSYFRGSLQFFSPPPSLLRNKPFSCILSFILDFAFETQFLMPF